MPEEALETPQPTASKSFDWPKIVLAVVLGLVLLAGAAYAGYWYGTESSNLKSQSAKPQLKTQNQVTPTPTPAPLFEPTPTQTQPITDPTADWETYENTKFNYQIKYPSDWTAKFIEPGPPAFDLVDNSRGIITFPNIFSGVSDARTYVTVETDGPQNLAYSSYQEWLASVSTSKFYTIESTTQETFAGVPATIVTGSYDGYGFPATVKTIHFKSLDNNTYFSIGITNEKGGARQNTVNQILPTFKFLD